MYKNHFKYMFCRHRDTQHRSGSKPFSSSISSRGANNKSVRSCTENISNNNCSNDTSAIAPILHNRQSNNQRSSSQNEMDTGVKCYVADASKSSVLQGDKVLVL